MPSLASVTQLSGWWRRAGALFIDGFLLNVAFLVVGIPLVMLFGLVMGSESTSNEALALVLFIITAFIVVILSNLLVYGLTMARKGAANGQSFGKQAFGIRVHRLSGDRVSVGFALLRHLIYTQVFVYGIYLASFGLAIVDATKEGNLDANIEVIEPLTGFFLVGFTLALAANYLWPLIDNKNQAFHDKFGKTVVARVNPDPPRDDRTSQQLQFSEPDNVTTIERLAQLEKNGVISKEEFEQKKQELLKRI